MPIEPEQVEAYSFNLSTFGREISTASEATQVWFNRGLTWLYTFNHMEAINCFRKALSSNASCAMAYWGIAFALGPNYAWCGWVGGMTLSCWSLS